MLIIEPPVSTAISSREQELLDRIALLEESLNKSVCIFPTSTNFRLYLGEHCSDYEEIHQQRLTNPVVNYSIRCRHQPETNEFQVDRKYRTCNS